MASHSDTPGRQPRTLWQRTVRFVIITALCVVGLLVLLIGGAVWLLTPESLTPMVSEYSSRYLDADVTAGKVQLKFWSTFPKVSLDVEDLTVVSHALRGLPQEIRASLPDNADTLLTLRRFKGGVNVWAMTMGRLMLYDVEIDHPVVNLVKVDSLTANYDIVPPSDTDTDTIPLPLISINRFSVNDGAPVRYFSLHDSIDLSLRLNATSLSGNKAPLYTLTTDGGARGMVAPGIVLPQVTFGLNGEIRWNQTEKKRLELRDFMVSADDVSVKVDADIDFDNDVRFSSLTVAGTGVRATSIMNLIPDGMADRLKSDLQTDLAADFSLALTKPYALSDTLLPTLRFSFRVPDGALDYDRVSLRRICADVDGVFDGPAPDASVINVNRLEVDGRSLSFALDGRVTSPVSDPMIDGSFSGRLNFSSLPRQLLARLPFTVRGVLSGDAKVRMRVSDLHPKRFHNIHADGSLRLSDFNFVMRDSSMHAFSKLAQLGFGTSASLVRDSVRYDSLLRVSVTADSLSFDGDGLRLSGTGLAIHAAARNTALSLDTTRVNPIGFTIKADRLALSADTDSMNVRLRDAHVMATLQRYKDNARSPLLTMSVSAGRARYSDIVSRLSLTKADVDLSLHPRSRRVRARNAATDSLAPRSRRQRQPRRDTVTSGRENFNFDLDRNLMSWLNHWQASGTVKAVRGRLLTPYFPVRNVLRNIDVEFSTDSLVLHNLQYRMGKSDFLINGRIGNIARALTSRRGAPLDIDFDIKSDTIDINNITSAILAGSAFAQKMERGSVPPVADGDDDEAIQKSISAQAPDTARAAFLVPSNLNARLNISAQNVLYADIWFQKLTGNIAIRNGAVHLDRLAGYTPMGSMNLTALYSAPTRDSLRFAAGIVVRDLHLHQFLHMLPEIDSILPLLNDVNGIITADAAMSTDLDSVMNLKFHTLNMVLKLTGDSLSLVDSHTFRTISKWLMFKHKNRNVIDHMQVELMVKDSRLDLFPFVFDIDRYRIGVSGSNSLDMDLDYRIAVLKSPLPFKFGITIKGRPGHLHFGLGRARFNENAVASSRQLTDTARINLIGEIEKVFKFGVQSGHHTKLMLEAPKVSPEEFLVSDTLTHEDSLIFIQGGALEGPAVPPFPYGDNPAPHKKDKKHKK